MLVAIATQGIMSLQLTQGMRICDLPKLIDGPVTITWEERVDNYQPSHERPGASARLMRMLRATPEPVACADVCEALDLTDARLGAAVTGARAKLGKGEGIVRARGKLRISKRVREKHKKHTAKDVRDWT